MTDPLPSKQAGGRGFESRQVHHSLILQDGGEVKVKNIKNLKREIEERRNEFTKGRGLTWNDELWRKRVVKLLDADLNDVDSFEAGLRRDAKDERIAEVVRNYIKRRVLGEGEEGKK